MLDQPDRSTGTPQETTAPAGAAPPSRRLDQALLRLELQDRVNAVLARATSLEEAAPEVLREIAGRDGWDFAGLWLLDPEGERLVFAGHWSGQEESLAPFLARSAGTTLGRGEGLPGCSWAEDRAIWLVEFEGTLRFIRRDEARACGLQSGCCFPIRLAGRVLGIMEFFSRARREEEADFLAVLDNLGNQVGQVAGRDRAESERARLLEILEATSDFIGMADAHGRVVYGNRAMQRVRGPDSPELLRPILEAHPAWAARKVLEEGLPAAAAAGVWRGETALLNLDGGEIPVSQVIVAHRDGHGQVAYYSSIMRDISEQKRTEHHLWTLLKNYEDLKYAVDESTIFAVTDVQGRILEVNERFCQVAGFRRDELLGKDHRILNSGLHPRSFMKGLWDTILAGRIWRGEIRNRAKDGSIYWVDATIVPWMGTDGRPERFISLRTVITDRKQAEERLKRREAQLEVLLRTSRDLNTDLEVSAVLRKLVQAALQLAGARAGAAGLLQDGRVRFREYLDGGTWTGFDHRFAPGQGVPGHVLETCAPYVCNDAERDPRVLPELRAALGFSRLAVVPILDHGAFLGCFEIHDTVDGRPFAEEDLWVLQGLAESAATALRNARMIAEREQQEAMLRHVQKMEGLGVLAGGIAHDFNNLLTSISGNVALARMHVQDGPQDPFLQSVEETVQRAADLTRQLLAYAGKGRPAARFLDLNALVAEMTRLLSVSCSKKAELALDLEPGLPAVLGDAAQLQQVVMNLVINASEALEGREGWIRVATGLREVPAEPALRDTQGQRLPPGSYVVLSVADSGCGMSPEVQGRIFDPFFSTKTSGHGLGLSALLGIVRGHGGWIRLESVAGQGSTFSLYLPPALAPPEEERPEPGAATAWNGGGRLLLVDDEAEIRLAVAPLLRSLGFEVVEASNGREAVARYQREGPFRLVLMDLSMPHMDGLEALREIRAHDPAARCVLMSGYDPSGAANFPQEAVGYLAKPFRFDRLKEAVRQALEGG